MLKNFKFVHEENRMAIVVRFSVETIKGMEFWGYFLAEFFHKAFFSGSNIELGFP